MQICDVFFLGCLASPMTDCGFRFKGKIPEKSEYDWCSGIRKKKGQTMFKTHRSSKLFSLSFGFDYRVMN